MAAIMPNLVSRDVRASWTLILTSRSTQKRFTDVRKAVSYDSDVANVAHGSTND